MFPYFNITLLTLFNKIFMQLIKHRPIQMTFWI